MHAKRRVERVVVLALEGVYPFELGIPSRIFGAADGHYEVLTCSVDGLPVRSNADFTIGVEHGPEILATADTVVVASMAQPYIPVELTAEVAAALALIRPDARVVSICTAAFVLAAAGLLEGRRATTHWQVTEDFRRLHPDVDLDPDVLFVHDGRILTSAGAASGVDVCLHIVRTDASLEPSSVNHGRTRLARSTNRPSASASSSGGTDHTTSLGTPRGSRPVPSTANRRSNP